MAKRYTATAQLKCRKQHTCASCGCVYSYVMERKVVGSGSSETQAHNNLQKLYVKTQAEQNDMHPCPNCGQYQPDMIGLRLASKRKLMLLPAFIFLLLIPILRAAYAVQANTLVWVAFFYCAAMLTLQFLFGLSNPNRDREANRNLAANRLVEGKITAQPMASAPELINPETTAFPKPSQSVAAITSLVILIGSVFASVSPELIRTVSGWPLNPDCYPPVVGPGDSTRIYMSESISSIKGYWRGDPKIDCQLLEGGPHIPIQASTNQNDWGSTIYAKSDEKSSSSHPWVELTLPDSSELAGKQVTCHIDLDVEYPQISGGGTTFQTVGDHMLRDITLRLASAGAGGKYSGIWWVGTGGSLAGVLVAGFGLVAAASAYRRKAKPAQILPVSPQA